MHDVGHACSSAFTWLRGVIPDIDAFLNLGVIRCDFRPADAASLRHDNVVEADRVEGEWRLQAGLYLYRPRAWVECKQDSAHRSKMSAPVASFTKEHTLSERSLKDNNRARKKRVLVTGGSGKLGRWVVREMVEHGWEVYNREYQIAVRSG